MTHVIAIDGAAGSGKSTLAYRLAVELELPYVNTGLMYRALTLKARRAGVPADDGRALASLAVRMRFDLDSSVRPVQLTIDGDLPGADLSSQHVESNVSAVSRHAQVRAVLRTEQRRLASGGAVMEGRDIGTVVAPGADLKLFLQARSEERVRRRAFERDADRTQVAEALGERDELDARTNPFMPARDAIVLDTTDLSEEEVFHQAMALVRERGIGP